MINEDDCIYISDNEVKELLRWLDQLKISEVKWLKAYYDENRGMVYDDG